MIESMSDPTSRGKGCAALLGIDSSSPWLGETIPNCPLPLSFSLMVICLYSTGRAGTLTLHITDLFSVIILTAFPTRPHGLCEGRHLVFPTHYSVCKMKSRAQNWITAATLIVHLLYKAVNLQDRSKGAFKYCHNWYKFAEPFKKQFLHSLLLQCFLFWAGRLKPALVKLSDLLVGQRW